jgi:uncharacterized protein YndB with AHSA1/START domain
MKGNLVVESSITINATPAQVWKALTTPALIKKYLMGSEVSTDWKEGSPIEYRGQYNGKAYHDKGVITRLEPHKIFQSTYWSSMGGKEDKPENYNLVTYELAAGGGQTEVKHTQDNVHSEEEQAHLAENWAAVLQQLKAVAEAGDA